MNQYNDNELLYLISESEIEAETLLYEKYSTLINSRIKKFKIKDRYIDDFVQEGYICLVKAIYAFDTNYNKSFNKFFDLILQRRFIQILKSEQKYFYNVDLVEDVYRTCESDVFEYCETADDGLSKFEKQVYGFSSKNYKPSEISKILKCDVKKVYNCLNRIKEKVKK